MKVASFLPALLATTGVALAATSMPANAFTLTQTLTGDPRTKNPDGLLVDVKIEVGENGLSANQALWTIDINSPLHSKIKLDEFYFNLSDSIKNQVTFSVFEPTGWAIQTPANNAAGSGSADFQFKTLDPAGPPNAADVTNTQNLSFIMTYNGSGALSLADFLNASKATSSDSALGSFQLGAHLQSLTVNNTTCPTGGCSNSGFAVANYNPGITKSVPEPGTILGLMAFGAGGLLTQRGRKSRKTEKVIA